MLFRSPAVHRHHRPRHGVVVSDRTIGSAMAVLVLMIALAPLGSARASGEAASSDTTVIVTAPFLDLRTGPGRGYPVTQSVLRGERVDVLYQRTGYVKVRTDRKLEGWAEARQLLEAQPAPLPDHPDHQGRP